MECLIHSHQREKLLNSFLHFFYLSLLDIIDFKEESDRLTKNLSKISKEIDKISSKLESPNFIENAPKNIILEQKERLEEYMSSKSKIEDAIKSFSN